MKKSFKYSILLLLLSFLIATLCCNSHSLLERYTEYPFTDSSDNDLNSLDNLEETLFKYNQVVSEKEYDIPSAVQTITGNRKYQRLLDTQPDYGNYRPFEARILSDNYRMKNTPSKIKGKRTTINTGRQEDSLDAQNLEPQVSGGLGTTDSVKERSSRGDFYYEPHSCIGQWSDWNNSHCGTESGRERCGIMFKKYEIVEREKNDPGPNGEPRPGKPCEYNDGITKYKYCFGENADDYESNMERCELSSNVCPCQLKNVTLLEDENVYDLEDENCLFELQRECICPRGYSNMNIGEICKLEPGVDCSIEESGCSYTPPSTGVDENCEMPVFMNEEIKNDFISSYSSIDGKCKEKKCNCRNGVSASTDECVIDGQELCDKIKPCNGGYYMSGNPPTCKKQTEGDNVYKECSCLYGEPRIEENTELRCNPSDSSYTSLLADDPPKKRQHCGVNCMIGYINENDSTKCNEYYPTTYFDNVSCCIPEYDMCKLEESDLEDKNIIRKDPRSLHSILSGKNLLELMEQHNSMGGTEITPENLIMEENPKAYLINKIIQSSDTDTDTQSSCNGNISVDDCYSEFKCSPGYSFLPSSNYSSEYELRITSCEKNVIEPPQNICRAVSSATNTSCLSPNAGVLSSDNTTISTEDGRLCMFPSYMNVEEVTGILDKYDISVTDYDNIICSEYDGTTCSDSLCQPEQIFIYNPVWNGACVPVTCNIPEEIKEIYNIPYNDCPSENMNCGLNNVTCKNASFEEPNTRRALYCRSPSKVGRDYLTVDYPLINIGCSSSPVERSSADEIRRERMASAGNIIRGDAGDQASQRQGPEEDNIINEANFTGSTEDQQFDFELGRQVQLEEVSEQVEERSEALASVVGGDQMRDELDILQGETRSSR